MFDLIVNKHFVKNMAAAQRVFCFGSIFLSIVHFSAERGEFCRTDHGRDIEYCDAGCCGESSDHQCCLNIVPIIIGAAVGGVFVIGLTIGLICCCYHMHKRKGTVGNVINVAGTAPSSTTHVVQQNPTWPNQTNYWQTQPGGSYAPPLLPNYTKRPEPDVPPPAYSNYDPSNYGMSGLNQPTPPSAPSGNRATTGV